MPYIGSEVCGGDGLWHHEYVTVAELETVFEKKCNVGYLDSLKYRVGYYTHRLNNKQPI